MSKARGLGHAEEVVWSIARKSAVIRPRDMLRRKTPHVWLTHFSWLELEQVGRGLYIPRGWNVPNLLVTAHKYPRLTVGLTSALHLHGLIDDLGLDWWVMGEHDRAATGFTYPEARYVRSKCPHEDRTEVKWKNLFPLQVHTPTRAVLDCIRHRNRIGVSTVTALVGLLLDRGDLQHHMLLERAKELHVLAPLLSVLAQLNRQKAAAEPRG